MTIRRFMATAEQIAIVVKLRGLGWSQQEIAEEVGMSRQAVAYQLNRLKQMSLEKGIDQALKTALIGGAAIAGSIALALLVDQLNENWNDPNEHRRKRKIT